MIVKNRERANVHIAWNTTFLTTHFAHGRSCKHMQLSNFFLSKFQKHQQRHLPRFILHSTLRLRFMNTCKLLTCNNLLHANNISGHYALSPLCRCGRYAQRIQQFVRLGANAFSQHGIEWRCIYIYQSPAQPHQTPAMAARWICHLSKTIGAWHVRNTHTPLASNGHKFISATTAVYTRRHHAIEHKKTQAI